MRSARLQVHGSANDLLAPPRRHRPFSVKFELPSGLRDVVQSTGVPHVEIGHIHVNGQPAVWRTRVDDGDAIEAWSRYPLSTPPGHLTFVLDGHLGRLAHYLRLFGFDTTHRSDAADVDLVEQSLSESRVLLTRDRGLLMRSRLVEASFIRSTDPRRQISEVLARFAIDGRADPLTRCMACNGKLRAVPWRAAAPLVPAAVRNAHEDFSMCDTCGRVYWQGSHFRRLQDIIFETRASLRTAR